MLDLHLQGALVWACFEKPSPEFEKQRVYKPSILSCLADLSTPTLPHTVESVVMPLKKDHEQYNHTFYPNVTLHLLLLKFIA